MLERLSISGIATKTQQVATDLQDFAVPAFAEMMAPRAGFEPAT
jgi:hypothetical protein